MFLGGIFIHLLKKNPISTSKTSILSNTFNQIIKRAIHKTQNALKKPQTVVYRAVFQRHSSPRSPTKSPWLIGFLPILYIRVRAYVSVYAYITNDIQKVVFFVLFCKKKTAGAISSCYFRFVSFRVGTIPSSSGGNNRVVLNKKSASLM